jgi:hypothetical protein
MSVPTHNLYDFIHQVLENRFNLGYFYPYGEKKLEKFVYLFNQYCNLDENLFSQLTYDQMNTSIRINENNNFIFDVFPRDQIDIGIIEEFCPWLICHDQEPLNFEFYQDEINNLEYIVKQKNGRPQIELDMTSNLRWIHTSSYRKKWTLLHSELNSPEVEKYNQSGLFHCSYWWSHAMISLDWYRFAKDDKYLKPGSELAKRFLIYARDTSGSRQYRSKFLNSIKHLDCCQTGSFEKTECRPSLSAEYNFKDFNKTGISIVLETVFDQRIHLTEKTLRPIACGHPFMIANGPGTLGYLKSYGFHTFHPFINENYDNETDTNKRLKLITNEIERIAMLSDSDFKILLQNIQAIAEHNKKIFFSEEFQLQIVNELKTNTLDSLQYTNEIDWNFMWQARKQRKKQDSQYYKKRKNRQCVYYVNLIRHLKKGGTLDDYVPPDLD